MGRDWAGFTFFGDDTCQAGSFPRSLFGGLNLVQALIKETLPSWFISVHGGEEEDELEGRMVLLLCFSLFCPELKLELFLCCRHQLIPDDDLGSLSLYCLLIDQPQEIRCAIGELVYDHLIAQKFNSSGLTGHDDSSSEVHIFIMLQILREFSTDPILGVYVIDDVWEHTKAMKDWRCIASMLLDQNPLTGSTNDEDSTQLKVFVNSRSVQVHVGAMEEEAVGCDEVSADG